MHSTTAANKICVIATSANWNVTYFECRVTLAPILTSLSRSVGGDLANEVFELQAAVELDSQIRVPGAFPKFREW
jgi:hypothetical protein